MAEIEPTIDKLNESTVMLNMRKLAGAVDNNNTIIQQNVQQAIDTANDAMEATQGFDDRISQNATAIETEKNARIENDITDVDFTYNPNTGSLEIQLLRAEGDLEDSVIARFIKTATLIPTSTSRAFKIRFEFYDGTSYDTNEFLIPEGGGTDVSVTGVTVVDGTTPDSFQVQIQLSDGEPLKSNDYVIDIPASENTYPTAVTGTVSNTNINIDITLNNSQHVKGTVDISTLATTQWVNTQLANYATTEDLGNIQEQITELALTSSGNSMSINGTSANIVNSISGTVSDGKLKISVNGVESGDIPLPEIEVPSIKFTNKFSAVRQEFSIPSTNITLASTSSVEAGINYKSSGQINVGATFIGDAGITMGINNSNSYTNFDVSSDTEANRLYTFSNDVIIDGTTITNNNFNAIEDGSYYIYPILLLSGNRRIGDKLGIEPRVVVKATISGNTCTIESFTIPSGDYYSKSTDSSAVTSITIEILADRFKKR